MNAYIDTHVAMWMLGDKSRITQAAVEVIDSVDLLISPIVYFEFQYMNYKKVLRTTPDETLALLHREFGVALCPYPFPSIIQRALTVEWTKDPFDRIITAHAMARDSDLITADRTIRTHYARAVW